MQETLQPATGSHVVRVLQLSGRTGSQAASLSVRRALPQGRRLQTGQYKTSDRSIQNFRQVSIKLQTGQYKSFRQVSTKVDTSHSGHQFHICGSKQTFNYFTKRTVLTGDSVEVCLGGFDLASVLLWHHYFPGDAVCQRSSLGQFEFFFLDHFRI